MNRHKEDVFSGGLNNAAKHIHAAASNKGFWDKELEFGTMLMLMVTELAEAMEADRKGKSAELDIYEACELAVDIEDGDMEPYLTATFRDLIKDSKEDELADTMIRILDYCGAKNIDIAKHINLKLQYNATRPHLHGKKY